MCKYLVVEDTVQSALERVGCGSTGERGTTAVEADGIDSYAACVDNRQIAVYVSTAAAGVRSFCTSSSSSSRGVVDPKAEGGLSLPSFSFHGTRVNRQYFRCVTHDDVKAPRHHIFQEGPFEKLKILKNNAEFFILSKKLSHHPG